MNPSKKLSTVLKCSDGSDLNASIFLFSDVQSFINGNGDHLIMLLLHRLTTINKF